MKFTTTRSGAVASAVLAAASLANAQNDTTTCASGVHMIVARGSQEPAGVGRIGVIAEGIEDAIPGSSIEAIDYPAAFVDYGESVGEGVDAMTAALTRYTERCPDGKVVLMGFSQGAQVTMDVLCGSEGGAEFLGFEDSPPYNQAAVNKSVIAVVAYGDPSHIAEAPWNQGNSTNDGLFARQNITACLPYEPIIGSWCDTGDRYCDMGNVTTVHGSYFRTYFNETIEFVVERFEKATNETEPETSGTPSGTPSSTSSPSPTGSGDAEESGSGDGGSAAGMVTVSWGIMAAAALVGFLNL